jgi:hypothetical protein
MARRRTDEDVLEPILPRHPPVAPEPGAGQDAVGADVATGATAPAAVAAAGRAAWERWVLLACALVSTGALVLGALRLDQLAEDQRLQTCQARAYLEEELDNRSGRFRSSEDAMFRRLAECIGVDVPTDPDRD